jgi:hypothetical protein
MTRWLGAEFGCDSDVEMGLRGALFARPARRGMNYAA